MYEQMRNEVLVELSNVCDDAMVLIKALDKVADRYDIKQRETRLIIYQGDLPEVVKIYLVCKKMAGLSDITLENYRVVLNVFFRMVGKLPSQVTANDIRMWLYAYQQTKQISNRSLEQYRSYISRFFVWAFEEGYVTSNPAKNIEGIKYEEKPREAMTQIELEYMRIACITLREKAIVEFLYSTGCRVSELAVIKKVDVNWNERSVHLFGKGRKHRKSFLNAKAEVALREYLESRNDDSEFLFVSKRKPYSSLSKEAIERIIRVVAERAADKTGKKVTPHIFRHTTATIALQNGMPIADISKLLGHESIDTTMIYAKTSLEDVRAGHRKYVI